MANYANLEAAIQAAIYENNTNDITGAALQTVLLQMVSDMGKSGMLCNGVCDGNTVPPVAPDSNIFYIAPTGTYANFGGLTVADGEWAIFIYNGGWQKQSIPVITTDAVPTTGSTNPVQSGGVADALDTKADIDGYYSTLTAGSAENLIGRGTVPAEYTRRTSGGSADIGSGAAAIEKIHGNTLAWNQMVSNGDFSNGTTGWYAARGTIAVSSGRCVYTITELSTATAGNRLEYNLTVVDGHKYYMALDIEVPRASVFRFERPSLGISASANIPSGKSRISVILTPTASGTARLYLGLNNTSGTGYSVGEQFYCDNVICVDLTLAGLDTLTASEFESLFPLKYYAYNTGSLLSLTGTGISTNGFNQWDEEWELGLFDASGNPATSSTQIRSKNYIAAFPSTTYFIGSQQKPLTTWSVFFYDATKTFISSSTYTQTTFTTPANCYYIRFCSATAYYGTAYLNDICINLSWSGYRNGEYEAYWDSTLALPITTVTSGGSAVFADGMKGGTSATGVTAYDELTSTKAIKRLVKVKMKDLTWGTQSDNRFYAILTSYNGKIADNMVFEQACPKYTKVTMSAAYTGSPTPDNVIWSEIISSKSCIRVRDTSAGGNVATFTTGLGEAEVVFEIDTPVEYTLDSEVNLNYRVDDFGTETLLPQNNATPTTAPIIYDVRYAMNAVDTLRNLPKNYISKDSMEHILTAMVTAGVISAYTLTWNATNENYDCTITA